MDLTRSHEKDDDHDNSDLRILGQSLIKGNCHNYRTSDDIDMELGPITKLDKRNKTTSKKLAMTSLPFFQITANLEQSGSRIPEVQSVKLMFSLIVTFHLTKTENRTKNSRTKLSRHCIE